MKKYWGVEQEKAIKEIIKEEDIIKKNKLIEQIIPNLTDVIKGVKKMYYYSYVTSQYTEELVVNDCLSLIVTKLHLYDPSKATAYSWISNVVKNLLYTTFVKTNRGEHFNAEWLKNAHALPEDENGRIYEFAISYDKDFEITTPVQIALDELDDLIERKYGSRDLNYLNLIRDELFKMKDDFSFERWIINICIEGDVTGYTLLRIFKRLGLNHDGIVTIWHNFIDRNRDNGNGIKSKKSLEKGYDFIYDDITPNEMYRTYKQYYNKYYTKIKDRK